MKKPEKLIKRKKRKEGIQEKQLMKQIFEKAIKVNHKNCWKK